MFANFFILFPKGRGLTTAGKAFVGCCCRHQSIDAIATVRTIREGIQMGESPYCGALVCAPPFISLQGGAGEVHLEIDLIIRKKCGILLKYYSFVYS